MNLLLKAVFAGLKEGSQGPISADRREPILTQALKVNRAHKG
jgi:hypothetical protein